MKYNFILSFVLLFVLMISFSSAFSWDQTQIEAYYSFDQITGNVIDEKGNFDGTNFGSIRGEIGRLNKSFNYEHQNNDYVNLTANPLFGIGSNDFSSNLWFKTEELNGSTKTILSLGYDIVGVTDASFFINIDASNNTRIGWYNDGVFNVNEVVVSNTQENQWYMVTGVRDGNRALGYMNGALIFNNSISGAFNSLFGNLGKFGDSVHPTARSPFNGKIDDAGIWNVSLNSSEVLSLYNDGLGKFYNKQFGSPIITLNSPSPQNDQLNLSDITNIFNVTLQGSSLSNVSLYLNGLLNETIIISGSTNETSFSRVLGQGSYNWSIEVCDINTCSSSENRTLILSDYLENSITYTSPTVEGTTESFILNLSLSGASPVSSAFFVYNGTSYSTNIIASTFTTLTSTINIPDFSNDVNVTFFWNVTLSTGQNFVSTINEQEVLTLQIDNCAVNTNTILNLSLFDERTLNSIFGMIEVDIDLNNLDGSLVTQLSTDLYNISTGSVCSNINISSGSYLYNLELRYYSSPDNGTTYSYVPEFYHVQNSEVSTFPMEIDLYDLNVNESTEFTIFYRDNDYIARPNVLLQILRKYVNEGVFRTIEIPITSSQGTAFGHFDLDNYKYKIIATENGVVLNTFDNPTIRCESQLSGICEIFLNGQAQTPQVKPLSEEQNFVYSIDTTNNSITLDYSIPNGESKVVSIVMIQSSPFADSTTICSQSLLSSSGSITCNIDETIGDSQVNIRLTSNSVVKADITVIFEEDLQTGFALNNYFIASMFLILLVTMFVSSPSLMALSSVLGIIFLGLIFLLKGSSVGLVVGSVSWLLLAVIIVIIKINKRNES